ncbi:MAG: S46 family peptidase [Myxococcaceae bacterium]|nr:S46 family peptidase [Myxococcaceae bacterium]
MKRLALALPLLVSAVALADEGMWTFNGFPADKTKAKYGFSPNQEWLDHVRLSSVRLARGCSASLVSADGLVLTNHHCSRHCIDQLSTKDKDFVKNGFFAKTQPEEQKCPDMEVNILVEITDVTKRVQAATKTTPIEKFNDVQKAELATIEKECSGGDELVRCEVVNLYRGGRFDLYKHKRYQEVKLVFAPEEGIAFFGGDPDNFMFPRYDLDLSFLRIYGKDGAPAKFDHFLKWSATNAKDGDLAFVSGHPGGTSRLLTQAQLEYDRDVRWPVALARLSEWRGFLNEFAKKSPEADRTSKDDRFGVENALKAYKGRHAALADPAFFKSRVDAEKQFRDKVAKNGKLKKEFGGAWDGIAGAMDKLRGYRKELELERGPQSDLFSYARTLVRWADESGKPNGERLTEFTEARLPQLKQGLTAKKPIYDEYETARLGFSLDKMREELGPDHPVIKKVYGQKSPAAIAAELVKGSKLKDPALRQTLFEGGKEKIDANKDPMLEFVRAFDAEARAIRKKVEDEVEGATKKHGELLAKAYFAVYGQNTYPDATFTLRLSYGQVKGWKDGAKDVPATTTIAGAFDRHTGAEPFALPKSWLDAKGKLAGETPFNMVTTNDIIGGNSGSPVVSKDGEVIGLIFDGNLASLGGNYGFDEAQNRAVAVHSAAIVEALDKVYGAKRIVDELKGGAAGAKAGSP